jgi:membrane-bound lytic murein transglycosylase D
MRFSGLLAAFILLIAAAPSGADNFPRPASLEPPIRFWRDVFGSYSRYQVVLHDTWDLDKVYSVLDFRASAGSEMGPIALQQLISASTDAERDRLRRIFWTLDQAGPNPTGLGADEQRIFDLYRADPSPTKFRDAADPSRLRTQRGLREKFAHGLRIAHRYLPEMERIFRDEGLPVELTRLPLVESCFDVEAYSKVGAAGIWQFMPTTGRLYAMDVNGDVDERRDPIASTRAAARFLRHNHEMLNGAWPLAITAYNHGPYGMRRAIRETGTTDIATIVHYYRGPAFGFASRNFYAEFLAALDVDLHRQAYFGELTVASPDPTHVIELDRSVGIEVAAKLGRTDRDTLAALNPALMDVVVAGRRSIPAGYALRLPAEHAPGFEERLADLVAEQRVVRVSAPAVTPRRTARRAAPATAHRVARGDTLSEIADRYKVSVGSLRTANGLRGKTEIRPGQLLKIPRRT